MAKACLCQDLAFSRGMRSLKLLTTLRATLCTSSLQPAILRSTNFSHGRNFTSSRRHASQYNRYSQPAETWLTRFRRGIQKERRESPVTFTLAVLAFFCALGMGIYTLGIYPRKLAEEFHGFPDEVAAKLRLALWYSSERYLNPRKALNYYKEAFDLAAKARMDLFGDQYFGMRLRVAQFLEQMDLVPKAVEMLERDREQYLKALEKASANPGLEQRRLELNRNAVALHAKLAELYSHDTIQDEEAAEARLTWAVTGVIWARNMESHAEDEGNRINDEQVVALFASLGDWYSKRRRHYLSLPLYLEAVRYCPSTSCHKVTIMNNISSSLLFQNPPQEPNTPAPSETDRISSARSWVEKAVETAAAITAPHRTEECDAACATALVNLGTLAMYEGDTERARQKFEEAKSYSKAAGYDEGWERADTELRRMEQGADNDSVQMR